MIFKIKVKPNSGKQEIKNIDDNNYKISLKSKPEDNKANIELIKLLKKYFGKDELLCEHNYRKGERNNPNCEFNRNK